ncbi:cysteinyl-tRNA synthetase 1 [Roseibium sp. TrichSKD4]|nr:cysteinyl-tRNA synthetase 1 [Roseibium sp. TrichSKD4]
MLKPPWRGKQKNAPELFRRGQGDDRYVQLTPDCKMVGIASTTVESLPERAGHIKHGIKPARKRFLTRP